MNVYVETFGCQMNLNESEVLSRRLVEEGHRLVESEADADLLLLNTCSIREHAEAKVLSRLGTLRPLKESGALRLLGVTGCMAQRLGGEFLAKAPYLDLVVGSGAYPRFLDLLEARLATGRAQVDVGMARDFTADDHPELSPGTVKTFLSIIRGCDNACHYCIVPFTRGPERSKPLPQILREAEWCVERGVREITLLGQNVNHYRDGEFGFADCLRAVAETPGLHRVRFTTSHPGYMTDDVLTTMARGGAIMPQLHLPVQSGSDAVLRAMNREYDIARYRSIVDRARRLVPEIALSTDIIVGYPGETERDFQDTVSLLTTVRFDSAFLFKYSPRRGTVAAGLPDDVPAVEKQRRLALVIALQRRITEERSAAWVGREVEVLVDGPAHRGVDTLVGKTREFRSAVFPGPESWIGSVRRMRATAARGVTLMCEAAPLEVEATCGS